MRRKFIESVDLGTGFIALRSTYSFVSIKKGKVKIGLVDRGRGLLNEILVLD